MRHLDLAYEKLSDLLDELYWAKLRYGLANEKLSGKPYCKLLKRILQRHEETAIHLIAILQKSKKTYEPFDIPDTYTDQEWAEILKSDNYERSILKFCLKQDKVVLKQMTALIDDGWLPTPFLSTLVAAEFQLKQSRKDLKKVRKNLKEDPNKKSSKSFFKKLRLKF
ncbi:hypothetical protein EAX61_07190 [Dokdonia sinensis]|uniref:DUF2383 domain-containing protein n=1 Tax=Dokdonia sinensis TaxID=2479847 RepID=A0A3M0G870_9FLAO|nr:hypothetical protein [Dokdonia sinensis]RMB60598.1 hypothetical protein EAX61_07190 [Dokdonia sinensis]